MIRPIILSILSCAYLSASTPVSIAMTSDLNLSSNQLKQLQQIDETVAQVKRHSYVKQIEVLTPQQRKIFFSHHKPLYEND
ncbi:MAG: hypothetical protein PHO27_04980 [Sulfuricurvum sp.]|nr:hypothetical protein [Sulfuricurvum sp.]